LAYQGLLGLQQAQESTARHSYQFSRCWRRIHLQKGMHQQCLAAIMYGSATSQCMGMPAAAAAVHLGGIMQA
jgi:hypothetical protein